MVHLLCGLMIMAFEIIIFEEKEIKTGFKIGKNLF